MRASSGRIAAVTGAKRTRSSLPAGRQVRIVEALRRMGTAKIVEIAEAAGMSNGAAFRYCYGTYEKGILSRIVNGNGSVRYRLR